MMKIHVWLVIALAIFSSAYAKEVVVFHEDFEDGDWTNNPEWVVHGGRAYIQDGQLHHDGVMADGSGRYLSYFNSYSQIPPSDTLKLSFSGYLKSEGNPQEGRGIHLSLISETGRYDLRINNGYTSGFPINLYTISIIYHYQGQIKELIATSFVPARNTWYNVIGERQNGVWYLYVNNELIGQNIDPVGIDNFYQTHLSLVGSVIVDNITVIVETAQEAQNPLLIKHAPVLYFHWDEQYLPRPVESMLDNADLVKSMEIIKQAPVKPSDISELDSKYSLDLTLSDIDHDHSLPLPEDFDTYGHKVYGRAVNDSEGFTHLQYFLFYPFQDWFTRHEGDWEMVQVTLNPNNRIESVTYFFDHFKMIYYDMDLLTLVNRSHPVVYVGKGSHHTYGSKKPALLPEHLLFFGNLFSSYVYLEKLGDDRILKPMNLQPENQDESNYVLEEVSHATPWLNYKGLWGENSVTTIRDGPKSPRYNPRFFKVWQRPERYTYSTDYPFVSVFVYSPVDLFIFDENNSIIPWDSGLVRFYTGPDSEPEAATLGIKNCTVNLIARETGQFSMEIYYYDNDTGIMLRYNNVSITMNTNTTVNVNKNSYFELCLDDDNDGTCDRVVLPDEIVTYNEFEYILPDSDGDGFNDFIDNCPYISNDQADFNSNGKGDACDNPRYYKEKALAIHQALQRDDLVKHRQVENHILESLRSEYWQDDFTVTSQKVFTSELQAVQFSSQQVAESLSLADSLIIERAMLDIEETSDRSLLAEGFYELGNEQRNNGKHKEAIQSFMKSWVLLRTV
jgi:hypothetical protein